MRAGIEAIAYALPEGVLTNEALCAQTEGWTPEKIYKKTGIRARHICAAREYASDLAYAAAQKLFASGAVQPADVDFILLATQSPDYILPTTACMLQERLGLPVSAGALDYNLGCSAYIYGLLLAKGLVFSGEAKRVLLLTAETYSKHIAPDNMSVRTIFGDGASATLISPAGGGELGAFDVGTNGRGYGYLTVLHGQKNPEKADLFMDGAEIMNFTLQAAPASVQHVLDKAGLTLADIDLFVFHQANMFMLKHLQKKLGIPDEKFFTDMEDIGNTVSASIPIALKRAEEKGALKPGSRVLLCGFGVGLSWGSVIVEWKRA